MDVHITLMSKRVIGLARAIGCNKYSMTGLTFHNTITDVWWVTRQPRGLNIPTQQMLRAQKIQD